MGVIRTRLGGPLSTERGGNCEWVSYNDCTIPIKIDTDPTQGYKSKLLVRFLVSPWLLMIAAFLPKRIIQWLFANTSEYVHSFKRFKTTHRALELLYTYPLGINEKHWWKSLIVHFWQNVIIYAQAARNRLIQVKKTLRIEIANTKTDVFTILSVGAGSNRAVLETVAELRKSNHCNFLIRAVDRSGSARKFCKELGLSLGLPADIMQVVDGDIQSTKDFERYGNTISGWNFVEVVGFMDYHEVSWCTDLVSRIYKALAPGGILLINNAKETPESGFMIRVIEWPLIFKEPEELAEILINGGFTSDNITIQGEPTGTFWMGIARKPN